MTSTRDRTRYFGVLSLVFAICLVATMAIGTAGAANTATKAPTVDSVTLRLGFFVKAEYAFIYAGLERGIFRKHNIDLEIGEGSGSLLAMQRIASGDDDFAYTGGPSYFIAKTGGMPIKMIVSFLQTDPGVILSYPDKPVKKLKDIEGKSIILVTGSAFNALWPTLVEAQKLDLSKIKVLRLGQTAYASVFLQRQGDVLPTFITSDALSIQDLAKTKLNMLRMASTGWGIVSNGLLAPENTLRTNPDLVRRMSAAMVESFAWAKDNPRQAATIIQRKLTGIDYNTTLATWKRTAALAHTGLTKGKPVGWAAAKDWQRSVDILTRAGLLTTRQPVGYYFTNAFLPKPKKK